VASSERETHKKNSQKAKFIRRYAPGNIEALGLELYLNFFFFFFSSTGVWTQGLTLGRQVLLLLEPLCQFFFVMQFLKIGSRTICPGWLQNVILLISASRVARVIGVSHQHLASHCLLKFLHNSESRHCHGTWKSIFHGSSHPVLTRNSHSDFMRILW
jgi:hypothetical protein